VFIVEINLASSCFLRSLSQISDDKTSTDARREGGSTQDSCGKILEHWTFDVKFSPDTQFTFGSLTFVVGDDGDLRMLPPGPAPGRLAPTDGQAPWSLITSSTSGGACSSLDPFAGLYIGTSKIIQGILVVMSTLRPSTGASSSSSSTVFPDQDLSDDYPEIGISVCGDSAGEGRLIFIVVPNGDPSHNRSSRYPTIGTSEASDARTSNDGMI
jgi:hypothetical protein